MTVTESVMRRRTLRTRLTAYRQYVDTDGMRTAPTRADRRSRTRAELIAVADRRFSADGYHATSLDAVADEAGFTKGAVYSNFASKEDLFFAVYERRVERSLAAAAHVPEADDVDAAVREQVAAAAARRDHDDGWLAVFLEFWTHVLRHPEHRARFAELHGRAMEPFVGALDRLAGRARSGAGPRLARARDRIRWGEHRARARAPHAARRGRAGAVREGPRAVPRRIGQGLGRRRRERRRRWIPAMRRPA